MVEIRNKGAYSPYGMIIEVSNEEAERKIDSGNWEYISKPVKVVETKPKKEEKPTKSWSEKKIKTWIKKNNIPIDYNISNDSKTDILQQLKDGDYL